MQNQSGVSNIGSKCNRKYTKVLVLRTGGDFGLGGNQNLWFLNPIRSLGLIVF